MRARRVCGTCAERWAGVGAVGVTGSHWREVRSLRRAPGHALPVGGSGRAPCAVGARCGPRCAGPCAGHRLHPDPGRPLRAAGRESAFPTLTANVLASAGGGRGGGGGLRWSPSLRAAKTREIPGLSPVTGAREVTSERGRSSGNDDSSEGNVRLWACLGELGKSSPVKRLPYCQVQVPAHALPRCEIRVSDG